MTGLESGVLFGFTLSLIAFTVALFDWWGRRSDRRSRPPRAD
jgi:hypothetical protein